MLLQGDRWLHDRLPHAIVLADIPRDPEPDEPQPPRSQRLRFGPAVLDPPPSRRHPRQQGLRGAPHIVDTLKDGGVQLVFNTTEGTQSIADSRAIRALTLASRIPYYTTAAGARAAALAMQNRLEGDLTVRSLQG
jgi:hypothetical protein